MEIISTQKTNSKSRPGKPTTKENFRQALHHLPTEIILLILQNIQPPDDISAKLALQWTCRRLFSTLLDGSKPLCSPVPRASPHGRGAPSRGWLISNQHLAKQMLLIETWPYYCAAKLQGQGQGQGQVQGEGEGEGLDAREDACDGSAAGSVESPYRNHLHLKPLDLFFCKSCWKLRPAEKFTSAMTSRSKKSGKLDSPGDRTQDRAYARMCIDCGIARYEYRGGTILHFGQEGLVGRAGYGVVCVRCSRFVEVQGDSRERLRKTCRACLEYRPPGTR